MLKVIESRTLALAHSLSRKLHTTSVTYVSNLQGLPNNIQQEVLSISRSATQVYANFNKAKVLGDLSDGVLSNTKTQLTKMKGSFDNVMDYLVNNTPMNWLVGPFYPRMMPEVTQPTPAPSPRTTPMEVQMESLDSSSKEWSAPKFSKCWVQNRSFHFIRFCLFVCLFFKTYFTVEFRWLILHQVQTELFISPLLKLKSVFWLSDLSFSE